MECNDSFFDVNYRLRVGLVTGFNSPDYSNLACQLEMTFPPQYSDNLTITTIQNGQAMNVFNDKAGDYYEGKTCMYYIFFL